MFQNIPLEVLTSWPPPSDHPLSRVPTVLVTEITLSVLLTIIVGLRIISRLFVTRSFDQDDWMILPAYVLTITSNIVLCINTRFGWGYHNYDIPFSSILTLLKLTYTYAILFTAANTCIKLAILLFYDRIFCPPGNPSPRFGRLLRVSMIFVLAWGIAFVFLCIFVCRPIHAYWNLLPIEGQVCYDKQGYKTYGCIDIVVDVYLLLLPQWKIWHMHMEARRKIGVAAVMSFAGLAVAAGVMRMPFIMKTMKSYDATWDGMELTLWSTAELTLGIGCTCAPALRAFFTQKKNAETGGRMQNWSGKIEQSVRVAAGRISRKYPWFIPTDMSDSKGLTSVTDESRKGSEKTEDFAEKGGSSQDDSVGEIIKGYHDLEWGQKMPAPVLGEEREHYYPGRSCFFAKDILDA